VRFRSSVVHGLLASAYGLNGETERAAGELVEAQRLTGDDHFLSIARLKAFGKTADITEHRM
jgi:hypothetical protein